MNSGKEGNIRAACLKNSGQLFKQFQGFSKIERCKVQIIITSFMDSINHNEHINHIISEGLVLLSIFMTLQFRLQLRITSHNSKISWVFPQIQSPRGNFRRAGWQHQAETSRMAEPSCRRLPGNLSIVLRISNYMGNICEVNKEPVHSTIRDKLANRKNSDSKESVSPKNLIQFKKMKISEEYQIDDLVGNGAYGNVFKVTHKKSRIVRAAKRVQKKNRTIESLDEFFILKKLDHPNIIGLYDIYSEAKYLYLVTQYCSGGELFDRIIQKGSLTEGETRLYMGQLLSGIHHCHVNGIMHRDLKPENIMFVNKDESDLKIIDFGVGTSFLQTRKNTLKVGSIYYIAPEVIKKKYNEKCDIWSLGVMLYIMLSGMPPFNGKTDSQICSFILKGDVAYPQGHWGTISQSARDLVKKMLTVDAVARISAKEALNHPWMKQQSGKGEHRLLGKDLRNLKSFCEMNQFQSAVMVFISHNFMQNEIISQLQAKFKEMDKNGDGRISYEEFHQCLSRQVNLLTQDKIQQMFSTIDKNSSGYIDYSEFITSIISRNYIRSENLVEKAFDMIDKDKNGFLSKQEMTEAFGGCNEQLYQHLLSEFDVNKDGVISKQEFKAAMKSLMKK